MSRFPLISALGALAVAGGCAVQGPQPTEQLTRARTMVEQADKAQAQRYAAAELQRAHDELSGAESAARQGNYDSARQQAESAAVDADVASAREAAGESRHAADELARSNHVLRQEAASGTAEEQGAMSAPPPDEAPPDAPNPPPLEPNEAPR
jgi:Domain of unknown function (DUF4398)